MTAEQVASNPHEISSKRLWFGFAGAVPAWILAGLLDVLLAWQACMGGELGSGPFTSGGMELMLGIITFFFLAIAVAGGIVSFRNWRSLAQEPHLLQAEGRARKEYMALTGVIISTILAVGIAWFSVPIYVLGPCVRYR